MGTYRADGTPLQPTDITAALAAERPARGLDAAGVARHQAAQRDRLDALRAATKDRPEHAEYLEALIEQGGEVEPWRGVSGKVADALTTDVAWCTARVDPGTGFPAPFPNAYIGYRVATARAAARRAATVERNQLWSAFDLTPPPQEDK